MAADVQIIEAHLPEEVAVARAVVSPSMTGGGLTFAATASHFPASDLAEVDLLFALAGQVRRVSVKAA